MTQKTLEQMADDIATEANACCHRSDGYEEAVKALALECLIKAYERGAAAANDAHAYF